MSVPMDWMYKRPTVDTEAYLLGKPIDKSLEQLDNPEGCPTSNEDLGGKVGALFVEAAASAALEAEAKLRLDPLYVIKKKEEEQRRMLLNNPVRLKKMQEELERQKKKEEKKQKSTSEKDILEKMIKLKSKYGTELKHLLENESGNSSSLTKSHDRDRRERRGGSPRRRSRSRSPVRDSHRHHQSPSSRSKKDHRSRSRSDSTERRPRHDTQSSHRNSSGSSRHTGKSSHSPRRPSRSPKRDDALRSQSGKEFSSASASVSKRAAVPEKRPTKAVTSSKLDPAELERKRLEMMADAKVRDDERANNLREHRHRTKVAEEKGDRSAQAGSGGFIRPMLETVAHSGTLESSLKSHRQKSQRTRADLDKNFTQR